MKNLKTTAEVYTTKAKNKDSMIFMAIGAIILVAIYVLFDGIKEIITSYDLKDWYYIFSIIGTVATLVAILVAVRIPRKILEKQNKIDLFKAKYEVLEQVLLLSTVRRSVFEYIALHPSATDSSFVKDYFFGELNYHLHTKNDFEVLIKINALLSTYETKIPLVFSDLDIKEVITDINNLIALLKSCYNQDTFSASKLNDMDLVNWYSEKNIIRDETFISEMKHQISITK